MSSIDPTLGGNSVPPERTPFKIQDPYTGRFVWNKDDDLHLRGPNGDGKELLWVLEYATYTTAAFAPAAAGYLLKNVLTGKILVDESTETGWFGLKEVGESAVLESQIWTMKPLEYEEGGGGGGEGRIRELRRLFSIQNQHSQAYIVNGHVVRGRKQLRTRVIDKESERQAWRLIVMSDSNVDSPNRVENPNLFTVSSHPPLPPPAPETPPRIVRPKRCRSGDYIDRAKDLSSPLEEQENIFGHDYEGDFSWMHVPVVPKECDDDKNLLVVGNKMPVLARISNSNTISNPRSTGEDSNFLQEVEEDCSSSSGSWMSQSHWKRWISAVSDFDVSCVTPKIGDCTRRALKKTKRSFEFFRADGVDLLLDSPWLFQPKLEEIP
ncbi:hypothetical protein R1flu_026775 [Riccia fluitans]|uniref:Uncharacterized protein n=1 Tax=Riccia fluitans TaxID=41844 RepID=A0ABD1XGX3_9MARC